MKPTSTQVTLALGLLAVGAVYLIGRKVAGSVPQAIEYGVQQITPWNHDNVFASTVNKAGAAIVTSPDGPGKNADGSWSLGGFTYDVQHLFSLSPLGMVSPMQGAADVIGGAVKKAGGVVKEAVKAVYLAPAPAPSTSAADWAQPTQYDALGNVINGGL